MRIIIIITIIIIIIIITIIIIIIIIIIKIITIIIITTHPTRRNQKIQCAQHVVAGWLTTGPHLSAPNAREDSTSNVLHKQGLPWSIFEAPTAGPARPVFPPLTVGQPNSRTEHHRSPETPLKG